MEQSPTNSLIDPGVWNQGPKVSFRSSQGFPAAAKGRGGGGSGGSLAGGRQITRNRASYSCHSCRRRKVKCDKVSINFLAVFWMCRETDSTGPSDMRKLRQDRNRMRVRCGATERHWFAGGANEHWTRGEAQKGDVAAGGGRRGRIAVDIRSSAPGWVVRA